MFIKNFNDDQCSIFVSLVKTLITADGFIEETEEKVLREIQSKIPDIEPVDLDMDNLKDLFPDRKSALSLLFELSGIAYIDGNYHEEEEALLTELAEKLGLRTELAQLEIWSERMANLVAEANELLEEESQ